VTYVNRNQVTVMSAPWEENLEGTLTEVDKPEIVDAESVRYPTR